MKLTLVFYPTKNFISAKVENAQTIKKDFELTNESLEQIFLFYTSCICFRTVQKIAFYGIIL